MEILKLYAYINLIFLIIAIILTTIFFAKKDKPMSEELKKQLNLQKTNNHENKTDHVS